MYFRRRKKKYYRIKSSDSEKLFLSLLEQKFNVIINKQFKIWGRFYDGQYKNILFEIDGTYWHSKLRQRKIDFKKDLNALKNGYQVIRIKLDSKEDVQKVFEENKLLLEQIFK